MSQHNAPLRSSTQYILIGAVAFVVLLGALLVISNQGGQRGTATQVAIAATATNTDAPPTATPTEEQISNVTATLVPGFRDGSEQEVPPEEGKEGEEQHPPLAEDNNVPPPPEDNNVPPPPDNGDLDDDGDGIINRSDACPNDKDRGFGVYADGCPVFDQDGDGVGDNVDACPNQGDRGNGVDGSGCPNPPPTQEAEPVFLNFTFSADAEGLNLSGTAQVNTNSAKPVTITWDFGDGNGASGNVVSHTYAQGGQYIVTVTVSDGDITEIDSREIIVSAPQVSSSACVITGATITSTPGQLPATVNFTASGLNIQAFNWLFGNGQSASGESVQANYAETGDYTYTLTCVVADDVVGSGGVLGADYVFTETINIQATSTDSVRLIASFVIEQGSLQVGQAVNLTSTSRLEGEGVEGATLSYAWMVSGAESFGGSGSSFSFTPTQAGVYDISLVVSAVVGGRTLSAPASGTVEIVQNVAAPNVRVILTPNSGKFPLNVVASLENTGGTIVGYNWDFGGGSGGDASSAGPHNLTFATAGKYTVSVSVAGPGGTASASAEVVVLEDLIPLKASFTLQAGERVEGTVQYCFTDTSEGDEITSFDWSLVNKTAGQDVSLPAFSGRGGNFCVTLTDGVYQISLSVSNPSGKLSSASALFEVAEGIRAPRVEIVGAQTQVTVGQTITYNASFTGAVRQFVWTITSEGGSEFATSEPSLTRTFDKAGNFVIKVRAIGPGGFAESASVNVTVSFPTISCPISGATGNVNYNASTTYSYSVNIAQAQAAGRTLTYAWTINGQPAGSGTSVTLPPITQPGTTTISVQVLADGQVVCQQSASVTFAIRTVTCDISGTLTPRLNQQVTYSSSNVANLDGRTVISTAWELSGLAAQGSNGRYTFTTPGTGQLTMTLTLSDDSTCTRTRTITVSESQYACRMSQGAQNQNVSLFSSSNYRAVIDGTTSGQTVSYNWTVNWNGGTEGSGSASSASSSRDLTVIFDKPGATYSVSADIFVNGTFICTVTRSGVGVGSTDPFTCDFNGNLNVFLNQRVTYSSTMSGAGSRKVQSYAWTLQGEGVSESGDGQNFSPIFRRAGSYNISFQATLEGGATCPIKTKTVTVSESEATCRLSIPANVPNDRNASLNVSVNPSGVVSGFTWTFNGKQYSGQNITIPATALLDAGLGGAISFTGTSSDGRTICALEAQLNIVERPLECRLSLPESITIGEAFSGSVNITNLNGRPVTYQWTVNDQPVSNSSSFSTVYQGAEGDVTVALVVTPQQGRGCSVSRTVRANEKARINALVDRPVVQLGGSVTLSAQTVGIDRSTLTWTYPDGSRERSETGRYLFDSIPEGGSAEFIVEGRNATLGTLRASVRVTVVGEARLNVSFTANPWQTTVGNQICFTDTTTSSNANIAQWKWSWDFAGLGSSDVQNPCFTFPSDGDYSVTLVVNDGLLTNNARNIVQLFSVLSSSARFDVRYEGRGRVCFIPDAAGVTVTGWDFGNGSSSESGGEVCATYAEDGEYTVTMRFRQGEAQSVVTRRIKIQGGGSVAFPVVEGRAFCAANGVATFVLSNIGADMTQDGSVSATINGQPATISADSFRLAGRTLTQTFTVSGAFGQTVTFAASGGGISPITANTVCAELPPTEELTPEPTEQPTELPTEEPTSEPTPEPTEEPTSEPLDAELGLRCTVEGSYIDVTVSLQTVPYTLEVVDGAATAEVVRGDRTIGPLSNGATVTVIYGKQTWKLTVECDEDDEPQFSLLLVCRSEGSFVEIVAEDEESFYGVEIIDGNAVIKMEYMGSRTVGPLSNGATVTIFFGREQSRSLIVNCEEQPTDVPPTQVLPTQVPPTQVPPTATPVTVAKADLCGEDMATRDGDFPLISLDPSRCGPDRERAIPNWRSVISGEAVCVDWLAYHTNITGDWEIFRLGELPAELGFNPDADVNISKGRGRRISDLGPARSPDSKFIAFSSNRDGNWEVYVAPVDGTLEDQQRVTYNDNAIDIDPVWSPDGTKLAYESTVDGNWEIRLVDLITGQKFRLTFHPSNDINPYWGKDSTKLLFQSDREGSWQIYELDINDVNNPSVRRLTTPVEGVDYQDALFSNDNLRIVMRAESVNANGVLQSVLFVLDLVTGELTQISPEGADARNASWSPNDKLIAYQSNEVSNTYDIYVYEVETNLRRLLTDNEGESLGNIDTSPTWICESETVVFTSDAIDGQNDIFSASARPIDGPPLVVESEANRMTQDNANDRDAQNTPSEENASRNGQVPPKVTSN
ncbi:MAG: PKD domain-containing protein [Anaerolineae bacterium]|nr:PKD domain-containing protein [Anaerolineae bacterium]MDW8170849.1 PKD domain-containing protein [Anaerolineae bacterium]